MSESVEAVETVAESEPKDEKDAFNYEQPNEALPPVSRALAEHGHLPVSRYGLPPTATFLPSPPCPEHGRHHGNPDDLALVDATAARLGLAIEELPKYQKRDRDGYLLYRPWAVSVAARVIAQVRLTREGVLEQPVRCELHQRNLMSEMVAARAKDRVPFRLQRTLAYLPEVLWELAARVDERVDWRRLMELPTETKVIERDGTNGAWRAAVGVPASFMENAQQVMRQYQEYYMESEGLPGIAAVADLAKALRERAKDATQDMILVAPKEAAGHQLSPDAGLGQSGDAKDGQGKGSASAPGSEPAASGGVLTRSSDPRRTLPGQQPSSRIDPRFQEMFNNIPGAGRTDSFGQMYIVEPPLDSEVMKRPLRDHFFTDHGALLHSVDRVFVDQKPYRERKRGKGGTVLLDVSGSMNLTQEQILRILSIAPAAVCAIYAGARSTGELRIIGRGVHMAKSEWMRPRFGNNVVDGPALAWLSTQVAPRVWISDGHMTGPGDGHVSAAAAEVVQGLIQARGIHHVANVEDALPILKGRPRRHGFPRSEIIDKWMAHGYFA